MADKISEAEAFVTDYYAQQLGIHDVGEDADPVVGWLPRWACPSCRLAWRLVDDPDDGGSDWVGWVEEQCADCARRDPTRGGGAAPVPPGGLV